MEDFLTSVTTDVDAYWMDEFAEAGLPEPRVSYRWIPAGEAASSACGDLGDSAAAYCPGDDTIYISEKFATDIDQGTLDRVLPGSSQGFGRTYGDFAVAYIVAHEYGHQVQAELGLFDRGLPTVNLELQADCYAGTWANSVAAEAARRPGAPACERSPRRRPRGRRLRAGTRHATYSARRLDRPADSRECRAAPQYPQEQQPPRPEQQSPEYPQADPGYGYPQQDPLRPVRRRR